MAEAGRKTRNVRVVAAALLGAALITAAALLWYPPPWRQAGYAPVQSVPFFERRDGLVNLNTATVAELTVLPGIGEKRAQAIVDYREANGPFQSPEELLNVSGIGDKLLEDVRALVSCT